MPTFVDESLECLCLSMRKFKLQIFRHTIFANAKLMIVGTIHEDAFADGYDQFGCVSKWVRVRSRLCIRLRARTHARTHARTRACAHARTRPRTHARTHTRV